MTVFIGCAGWSIARQHAESFATVGTHLQRYATTFNCVEINSSFYRPHRPGTYGKWAELTPSDFRFSVKMPRAITHDKRLLECDSEVAQFLEQIAGLGAKLGPILVQLPPSLVFNRGIAHPFLTLLRKSCRGAIACEPRHPTWFSPAATEFLADFDIARVAADPACVPQAALPAVGGNIAYWRLHGSPRVYYSDYDESFLTNLAAQIRMQSALGTECWCLFDNTALGNAIGNAISLGMLLGSNGPAQ